MIGVKLNFKTITLKNYYKDNYISALDGLRGLMALWVFYGHFQLLCIGTEPFFGDPTIAVDIFMLLSGFLMYYQWEKRWSNELSFASQTKVFYLRRFFRIAPLYFVLLTVVYAMGSYFNSIQLSLNEFVPQPWADEGLGGALAGAERSKFIDIISHYTFVFGFLPKYVETNILPDWSIGLEMQFYLFFPFLVMIIRKIGWFPMTIIILALTLINSRLFGLYGQPGLIASYVLPGFLGFKLYIFLAGMLLGGAYLNRKSALWMLFIALGIIFYSTTIQFKAFFVLCLFILFYDFNTNPAKIPGFLIKMTKMLGSPFGKFLGNTSYSVYLVHMLILFPILVFLHGLDWFAALSDNLKMLAAGSIVIPLVYLISYVLFKIVELPGISFGRQVLKRREQKVATPVS